jgi:hypothetical protein
VLALTYSISASFPQLALLILRINTVYFPKGHNPVFLMETVILELGVHGGAVG